MTSHIGSGIVAEIDLALSLASLALLAWLLVTYVRLYLQMRQSFTLGFIIFAGLLILQNVMGTGFLAHRLLGIGPRRGGGPPPPPLGTDDPTGLLFLRLVPSALQLVALGVLVWLTRK